MTILGSDGQPLRYVNSLADPWGEYALRLACTLAEKGKLNPTGAMESDNHDWHYRVGDFMVNERLIPHQIRPWRTFRKAIPYQLGKPYDLPEGETFWTNSHYLVYVRVMVGEEGVPDAKHLSLRTVENDVRHDWREFQRVKNELAGEDWEGVELYPRTDRLVDSANQFHLWCFPFQLPFGFKTSLVDDGEIVNQIGGAQRPHPAPAKTPKGNQP